MPNNLLLNNQHLPQDQPQESIRPKLLSEFIGQSYIKKNLTIFINSAKSRLETLDHTLLYGPPGLGKTTLAQIIATEMGGNFKSTAGPVLTKPADLAAMLTNLKEHDVFFIDEIHRLNVNLEEILYSAMEDFIIDVMIGEGPGARSIKIHLPKFTLIGATTRLGLLTNPLKDRFSIQLRLDFYKASELSNVIIRAAKALSIDITDDGAGEISHRARGTPRIALRLLRRVRDFAINDNCPKIDSSMASIALNHLEVDKMGLDNNDYRYIKFIVDNYNGGPVGVETIAAGLAEQRDSIEEAIEPYLIQLGFLHRTPRGRVLTNQAYQYLEKRNF